MTINHDMETKTNLESAAPTHSPLVMLVDDDELILALLEKHLSRHGFRTCRASGEKQCLCYLEINGETPDLIILDMNLGDGDGGDCCRRIKERYFGAKVILTSGMDNRDLASLAATVGSDDHLPKPFTLKDVSAKLDALLLQPLS